MGIQIMPIAATQKNVPLQPNLDSSIIARGAHSAEPKELPKYNKPIPRDRSLNGSTRWMVWAADGIDNAAPNPIAIRSHNSAAKLPTTECIPITSDVNATVSAKPSCGPITCTNRAPGRDPIKNAPAKPEDSHPYFTSDIPSDDVTVTANAASTCRCMSVVASAIVASPVRVQARVRDTVESTSKSESGSGVVLSRPTPRRMDIVKMESPLQ
jgi:hypothetical protein